MRCIAGMGKAEKTMYRKQLERAFCWKLTGELALFRYGILQEEKEAIYQAAFQIDSMVNIYGLLMEMSGRLSKETLEAAVMFPDILTFLYGEWLRYEDSYTADIQYCLERELAEIRRDYKERELAELRRDYKDRKEKEII